MELDRHRSKWVRRGVALLQLLAGAGPFPAADLLASSLDANDTDNCGFSGQNFTLIVIHTNLQQLSKSNRTSAVLHVLNTHPDWSQEIAEISIRGSSSRVNPKKCFRLEIQDGSGNDKKVSLAGSPTESDWILYASYTDKTFIRNALAQDLRRAIGWPAVRTEFVELAGVTNRMFPEGVAPFAPTRFELGTGGTAPSRNSFMTNEYHGLYLLMEKIKRNKHRVAIEKLDGAETSEPEITGGYIFKHDRVAKGELGFQSSRGIPFQFEEPKEREITPAQRSWLTNHINEFERVLFSDKFADPVEGYRKFINVESFIDYHWIVEASRNMDGYNLQSALS